MGSSTKADLTVSLIVGIVLILRHNILCFSRGSGTIACVYN